MKKIIVILALALGTKLSAQNSIQLSVASTSALIPANTTLTTSTVPGLLKTITVDVKNIGVTTHTYDVKRYDLVINKVAPGDSAVPNFCFATLCTGQDVTLSIVPLILNAGASASDDTTADYNMLDADLIEASAKGFSAVKYTVFESNNPNDSVQFSIHYNKELMLVGIDLIRPESSQMSIFPNPGKQFTNVSIQSSQAQTGSIRVVNALGQIVQSQEVFLNKGSNTVVLNLADLPKGIFLVQLKEGENLITKKLIID